MQEKGYVYILTNPSFRDDWVKIGKTKDLNKRLSELNKATGIPLPFKIYATIRTKKYEEIEKNMHDMFGDLAGSRVNIKREFFQVMPETAFKYLEKEGKLCDDVEIFPPKHYQDKATGNTIKSEGNSVKSEGNTVNAIIESIKKNGGTATVKEISEYIKINHPELYNKYLNKHKIESKANNNFQKNIRATIYTYSKGPKYKGKEIFILKDKHPITYGLKDS